MKKTASILIVLLASLTFGGCIIVAEDDGGDASFTIENRSSYVIYSVYLATVDSRLWGEDQLGGAILRPGDSLEIYDIECDYYDVQVVDEFGTECEIHNVDLCFNDSVWAVTNRDLATCSTFGSFN